MKFPFLRARNGWISALSHGSIRNVPRMFSAFMYHLTWLSLLYEVVDTHLRKTKLVEVRLTVSTCFLSYLPVWGVSLRPELVTVRNWQELTRLVNYMALMLGLSFPAGKWGHHLCTVHGGEQLWGNDFAEVMPVNTPCKQRGRHSDVWYHF